MNPSTTDDRRLLIVSLAGVGYGTRDRYPALARLGGPQGTRPLRPVFPALTCPVQATATTGAPPGRHGIVANGLFDRDRNRAGFWDQSDRLVQAPRTWDILRRVRPRTKTAMFFWQNSIGSSHDLLVTPAPIHKHHGGMIEDCYTKPPELGGRLRESQGRFRLKWYWGPFTSQLGSRWIADATVSVLRREAPALAYTYLPLMDYNAQRFGPDDLTARQDAARLDAILGGLIEAASAAGYDVLVFSDYAIRAVRSPVFINRILRTGGWLRVRPAGGREYLDPAESRAWALADHQVAHVFCAPEALAPVKAALGQADGVARVLDPEAQRACGIAHPRSGELVAVTHPDRWFAYPWWEDAAKAPDYAHHVDIHNKPGYDPCELFWGWIPPGISTDASRVRGSHGHDPDADNDRALVAASWDLGDRVLGTVDLHAETLRRLGIEPPPAGGIGMASA